MRIRVKRLEVRAGKGSERRMEGAKEGKVVKKGRPMEGEEESRKQAERMTKAGEGSPAKAGGKITPTKPFSELYNEQF